MNGIIGHFQTTGSVFLTVKRLATDCCVRRDASGGIRAHLCGVLACWLLILAGNSYSAVSTYQASPNNGTTTAPPLVMLLMSNDHEMFKKAYSDSSDVNGDGSIDSGYIDTIDYSGYFNNSWCYQYSSGKFTPESSATGTNGHFCTSSGAPWSGNFLNWAAMTRIDLVRSIFYGGKRSTDTASSTVLERGTLSAELDAFTKVYSASDVGNYTPYSSAITFCVYGSNQIRIASGSHPKWATTEISQCQWRNSDPDSPSTASRLAELTVRVEVCVNDKDANTSAKCRLYPDGNYKPFGLLQEYGEDGAIRFGLMSGTVNNRKKGGVLRRNIGRIASNADAADDEVNLSNGVFDSSVKGVIYHMSRFRLHSGQSGFGNPISEMYLEALRYFSGQTSPDSNYNSDDSSHGYYKESWRPPLSAANSCASCSIILISSTLPSFDKNDLAKSSDLPGISGMSDINTQTNRIGNLEDNISFPDNFFYGGTAKSCTRKSLANLSSAIGICPAAPRQEGGYLSAGLSFYARANDINSSLSGLQDITTYVVQIQNPVPALSVNVNNDIVSFTPVATDAHFKSMSVLNLSSDGRQGEFYFVWEGCEVGCDNDFDSGSSIEFCILDGCTPTLPSAQIKITSRFEGKYTSAKPTFSFNINGTTEDGIYGTYAQGPGGGSKQGPGTPVVKTYTVRSSTQSAFLPSPLELMAKYGGFSDLDGDGTPLHDSNQDGTPDSSIEWDNRNNLNGARGKDGIADNYFFANNPALLEDQLGRVLRSILTRASAGSNVALVSNNASGAGSATTALFQPSARFNNIELNWIGQLNSMFIDGMGHFREDTNQNGILDDYNTDRAVSIYFDSLLNQPQVQKYTSTDNGMTLTPDGGAVDLDDLIPIWGGHDELMELTNVTTHRPYDDPSDRGRHIFTWLDNNDDGLVGSGEELPLVPSTFSSGREGYLDVAAADVAPLINYIRGEDQAGFRSRSADVDNDGNLEVWRLGDIIHSSPVSVSEPRGFYSDTRSYNPNDTTFINFLNQYRERRQVIYVGSNGGLLHAFNAGFWNENDQRFYLSPTGETAHPLGGEIWAYAPMNLLPHLQWLTEPDYSHVYYMDGAPLIFDANIFPDDADHPGGWGTVLVMGMGQGGGPIDVNIGGTTKTRQSAFVVMDITNPEEPPKLIAEISHPEMGFTTVRPELIQKRQPDSSGDFTTPAANDWYLAFGSGPRGTGASGIRSALDNATSDQNLKVFIYDLQARDFVSGFAPYDTGITNSYAGDMSVIDWDNDKTDDFIYFGSVNTSPLGGELLRIDIESASTASWAISTMVDVGRPITSRPLPVTNKDFERWLYFGTGRELVQSDSLDTAQEYFVGIKEPQNASGYTLAEVPFSDLIDTTDVEVRADGQLTSSFTVQPGRMVSTFNALRDEMRSEAGWINRFQRTGTAPSSKSTSSPISAFALLIFTEYEPPADQCQADGNSYLNVLHYQTGTALPAGVQQVITEGTITDTTISTKRRALGRGHAPEPVLHDGGDGGISVIVQGEAGNITQTDFEYKISNQGRQSWRQIHKIPRW
ncbi:pilus assembly protein [Endozoicomonas ascidiicola]|uniref:pilus assembly protein n=1 Tax=Endozoicomonas ascidiicola TaxID=1698521 RepID=UPI000AFB00EC|nr:PilC/PilY family type IV pilus protein [Endozoicomonas ascidiicola]